MRGHLGWKVRSKAFTPYAEVLGTDGTWQTYNVPAGARSMTVWVVGSGGEGGGTRGAGGVAWRTYSVSGGQQLLYNAPTPRYPYPGTSVSILGHASSSFQGSAMTANPGRPSAATIQGVQDNLGVWIGDYNWGGASGDLAAMSQGGEAFVTGLGQSYGGAIGNVDRSSGYFMTNRTPAGTAVSSLKDAVALAGYKVVEDDDLRAPAFGSGGYRSTAEYGGANEVLHAYGVDFPNLGFGGGGVDSSDSGGSCVVVYFE